MIPLQLQHHFVGWRGLLAELAFGAYAQAEVLADFPLLVEAEHGQQQAAQAKLRLSNGTYGVCQRCGDSIVAARLQVLPTAAFCLGCADLAQ